MLLTIFIIHFDLKILILTYNFLPILYWPITVEIRQNVLVVRNTNMRLLRSYSLFNSDLLTI